MKRRTLVSFLGGLLIVATSFHGYASLSDLKQGVLVTDRNIGSIAATSLEYARARKSHRETESGAVLAFLLRPGSSDLYSLSEEVKLHRTNFETSEVRDRWSVSHWVHAYVEPEYLDHHREVGLQYSGELHLHRDVPGCLADHPLRYGDVVGDEAGELVLFIGNELLFFSPEQGRVIFMTSLTLDGWLTQEETIHYYENSPPGHVREADAQYQSEIAAAAVGNFQGQRFPGYRGHAKVYIADFDDDTKEDIVVWRKLYQSRLRNDPVQGFKLVSDTLLHYQATTEGYRLQKTDDALIRTWLASKELTWQDGFPNKSECPGQEDQLIPEMHDPLLNDPEVLK